MKLRVVSGAVMTVCLAVPGIVFAQQPPGATQSSPAVQSTQSLEEMVTQLRATPSNDDLRHQIIARVAQMKRKPEIPEEARRAFVQGNTAFTSAQGPGDYQRAADRFNEALAISPWWGDVYFNLSKTREQQGDFDRAIRNLKDYLLSAPPIADARAAQDQIYVLEDKKAAAAQRQAAEAQRIADEAARKAADPWSEFEGARYQCEFKGYRDDGAISVIRKVTYVVTNGALERTEQITYPITGYSSSGKTSRIPATKVEFGRVEFFAEGWAGPLVATRNRVTFRVEDPCPRQW